MALTPICTLQYRAFVKGNSGKPLGAAQCELVHIGLTGFRGSIRVAEGPDAMAEQPAKRIPDWLAIDLLVILGSLAIIVIGIWIGL
jgi:hypothetical protein